MNTQNVEFLQSQLRNCGFGESLNQELSNQIAAGKSEFQLKTEIPHFNNRMEFSLFFKKSDTTDMYFFNKYDSALKHSDPSLDKQQTFYVNNGSSITAKEAFNLLEGRSVHKELKNQDQQKYKAWLKLDFDLKSDTGNFKIKQFGEKYGYDLEKTLRDYPIKEMADPKQKEDLVKSLERGNVQSVTIVRDNDNETKFFIEASPQYKNINAYDRKMNPVKRQSIEKAAQGQTVSESTKTTKSEKKDQKVSPDDAPAAKAKKRQRKGMSV